MDNFLETLKQLGPGRLGIMAGVLLALLIFFVFVSMRVSSPDMKLLYSDLSTIDSSAIAAKLEETKIPYIVTEEGSRVMVSEEEVGRARMLLAEEGLPNGGSMGYELFDQKTGFGATNFEQNISQVRALEGELSRTISSLDGVRSARIHLVLPKRQLFSRESLPASASVFIGIRPGAQIQNAHVDSIRSLVASAVPQLKPSNVSVIDQHGNLLARADSDEGSLITAKAEDMKRSYEQRMTQSIEDMVGRIVGYGRVRATVTADMNFDRISTNEELFDPASQVARSAQVTEESSVERGQANDNVSVENNLPGVGNDLFLDSKPSLESNRIEEVTNFEISKTVRNSVRETGDIQRLSVAVLVDGTYTEGEDGTRSYEPRKDEELDQIAALVRSAIGFDAARGDTLEVVNMQFAEIETEEVDIFDDSLFGFDKGQLLDAAEIITVAIMIVLVVLLVLQPMVSRLLEAEGPALEDGDLEAGLLTGGASPALEGPSEEFQPGEVQDDDSLINVEQVEGKVRASSVKKVEDIVDAYPAETVSVIRNWMSQEG